MLRTAILELRRKATLTLLHFGSLMLILYRFNLYKMVGAGGRRRYSAHIPGADSFVGLPENSEVYRTEYKFQPMSPGLFSVLTEIKGKLDSVSSNSISC